MTGTASKKASKSRAGRLRIMVLGVGSFAHSTLAILKDAGADVFCYLTRDYGHHGAQTVARCYFWRDYPDPAPLIRKLRIDLLIPMSIDWAEKPWADALTRSGVPILCPTGTALDLEKQRDLARVLCAKFDIPFPRSHWAKSRGEAERLLKKSPRPYVIKNPICGPTSPIHTIVCESAADTAAWLPLLDYKDGVFLQEYLGRAEAGHIAFVTAGEIHPVVTNQEYKRAFDRNQGIVAGAPLGGLVEQDSQDKYSFTRELLVPLLPWLREVNFHGPVQVTAIRSGDRWHVLEYNVRIGVTSGAMILRMLHDPLDVLMRVSQNQPLPPLKYRRNHLFGCSVTLAGYGYPYTQVTGPEFPISLRNRFDCDVWWNEVRKNRSNLLATGHRIADVVAIGHDLPVAIDRAYRNIHRIHCLASYCRTDIGASLWPPGSA